MSLVIFYGSNNSRLFFLSNLYSNKSMKTSYICINGKRIYFRYVSYFVDKNHIQNEGYFSRKSVII